MTEQEWETISQHLEHCFAGDFDDHKAEAYATFMGHLGFFDVMTAINELMHRGQRFVPSAGEILGVLDEASGPPSFDRAWRALERAMSRYGLGDAAYAESALVNEHPAVVDWARSYGWRRLTHEPVNDPDYGGAVMHRLGRSYREHCSELRLRERADRRGLPGAQRAQLGVGTRELEEGAA